MKSRAYRVLQVLMLLVCVAHIVIGAGLNLASDGMVASMASSYGAESAEWSAQLLYIVKPLGAFMLVLGLLAAAAAANPTRYRAVVYAFSVLFLIRAVQRIAFSTEIHDIFGIAVSRNTGNAIFFAVLAVVLVVCDRLAARPALSEPA